MQKFVQSISQEPYAPPGGYLIGMWVGLGPKVRMVTFMEVKGHQEVKWGKLCAMATIFGQKKQ